MSKHLTAAQLTELKTLLEARKATIEARLQEVQEGQSRSDHAREILLQDSDDLSHRASDREVDLVASDMGSVDLARINAALERMKNGTYGYCDECGCEIPYARLKLEPQTQHCVTCKGRWEKRTAAVPDARM